MKLRVNRLKPINLLTRIHENDVVAKAQQVKERDPVNVKIYFLISDQMVGDSDRVCVDPDK
jgi:hypothetical protein